MGTLKRALLYITRKKGRSIILLLVFFALAALSLAGLSIQRSAAQAAEEYRETLGSSFKIKISPNDDPRLTVQMETPDGEYAGSTYIGPMITKNMLNTLMNIPHIKDYTYDGTMYTLYAKDLKLHPGGWTQSLQEKNTSAALTMTDFELEAHSPLCISVRNSMLDTNFRMGAFELTEGRHIQPDDTYKALISEELAARNKLSIGDIITFEIKEGLVRIVEEERKNITIGEPIQVQIAGIFRIHFEQEASEWTYEDMYAENFIYVDQKVWSDTARALRGGLDPKDVRVAEGRTLADYLDISDNEHSYSEVTIFVDDPAKLDEAINEAEQVVDKNYFQIVKDDSAYRASVEPLNTMTGISTLLVIALFVGGMVVLGILLTMWIRSRRHEIGILLSIGMKKGKIFGQLFLEVILIAAVGFACAWFAAGVLAAPFGQVAQEAVSPKEGEERYEAVQTSVIAIDIVQKNSEKIELSYSVNGRDFLVVVLMETSFVPVREEVRIWER